MKSVKPTNLEITLHQLNYPVIGMEPIPDLHYKRIMNHHQLEALKLMWDLPEDILNKILWVNTPYSSEDKDLAIGLACQYLNFMEGVDYPYSPSHAWEEWCISNKIEHEIENNPYY